MSNRGHTESAADQIRRLEREVALMRATLSGVTFCDNCPTCQSNAEATMKMLSDEVTR